MDSGRNRKLRALARLAGAAVLIFALQACAVTGNRNRAVYTDPWLGQDKLYHVLASAGISRLAALQARDNSSRKCAPLAVGIGVTLSIGTLKELYDKNVRKTLFSWRDMAWNTAGAIIGGLSVSGC